LKRPPLADILVRIAGHRSGGLTNHDRRMLGEAADLMRSLAQSASAMLPVVREYRQTIFDGEQVDGRVRDAKTRDELAKIDDLTAAADAAIVKAGRSEEATQALTAELVAMLKACEWAATVDLEEGGTEDGCPACSAGKSEGHSDTCCLAALQKKAGGGARASKTSQPP
jgi:hypothetical protein